MDESENERASRSTQLFVPLVIETSLDDGVDIVKLTPSHLALLRDLDLTRSRVRRLIVGGEDLKTTAALKTHDAFGGGVEIYVTPVNIDPESPAMPISMNSIW